MANMLCKPKHLSLDPQHPSIYNNEGGKGPCSRINERGAWGKGGGERETATEADRQRLTGLCELSAKPKHDVERGTLGG